MVNHKPGANYSLGQLLHAYNADPQDDTDANLFLAKGDEIVAVCLRHKHAPRPNEIWIGAEPAAAAAGAKLAALKDKKTLPVYHRPRARTLYEFKGPHVITGDTQDQQELANAKSPVPLSRIVFITPVQSSGALTDASISAIRNR